MKSTVLVHPSKAVIIPTRVVKVRALLAVPLVAFAREPPSMLLIPRTSTEKLAKRLGSLEVSARLDPWMLFGGAKLKSHVLKARGWQSSIRWSVLRSQLTQRRCPSRLKYTKQLVGVDGS